MKPWSDIPLLVTSAFLFLAACLAWIGLGNPAPEWRFLATLAGIVVLATTFWHVRLGLMRIEVRQQRFNRLVEQSPFGLVFIDERPDGVLIVTEANDSAHMLFGGGIPLACGKALEEVLPGLRRTDVPRRLSELAHQGGTAIFDGLPYEQEGISGVYDLIAFPLAPGRLVISVTDASSRMLLAETIHRREVELSTIVDVVVDAILIVAADGRNLYANHAACGMTGYTIAEIQNMGFADMFSAEDLPRLEEMLAELSEDESAPGEWAMRRKDGSGYPAEIAMRLLPDGRRLAMVRDISARKRDEERLQLAAKVFTHAHEAIIITNATGVVIDVNDAFCTLTGYARSDMIGRNPRILQSGRHDSTFYRTMWHSLRESGHWTGEVWNRRRDGSLYVQLNSISAVKNQKDEITHYVGMSFDITQRKEDELALLRHRDHLQELVDAQVADLLKAKDDAERANSAKSEFLANMSHELRTPMHAILGFSELGGPVVESNPAKAADYFSAIHKSGERLLGLLNDLLDLSKLEAGRTVLQRERVELDELVRGVFSELAPLAIKRRINLRLGVLSDQPVVEGDRKQLEQVVRNLVSNALRFSPEEGVVDVAIEDAWLPGDAGPAAPNALRLSVADRGPGIPVTEMESIFDKFIQSSLTRDGAGGTGLGLSISREIVSLHGGRIIATNRLEGGALFDVLLPC